MSDTLKRTFDMKDTRKASSQIYAVSVKSSIQSRVYLFGSLPVLIMILGGSNNRFILALHNNAGAAAPSLITPEKG